MKVYLIIRETDDGDEFSMASGRGASVNSVAAFSNLESAKRAVKYRKTYGKNGYRIVEVTGYSELQEETV